MIEVVIDDPHWTRAAPGAEKAVREASGLALGAAAGGDGPLSVLLTDDEAMRGLCARFRGDDKATNVLAFPAAQGSRGGLGDIALAYGVCEREAVDQGKTLTDHLRHLVIHGVLHLLGYDHERANEARVMERLEIKLLARLGVANPYEELPRADEHVAAR